MNIYWSRSFNIIAIGLLATGAFIGGVLVSRRDSPDVLPVATEAKNDNPQSTTIQPEVLAVDDSMDTKFGPLRIQASVVDLYPQWRQREKFKGMSRLERIEALNQIGIGKDDAAFSAALHRGVFDPATAVLGALQRFLESSAFATMPTAFELPRKWNRRLTIKIVGAETILQKQASFEPSISRNAYYDRDSNTIAISLNPALLNFYFAGASSSPSWKDAGEAWAVLKRTLMKPLYHELTHALQVESGRACFWSPVLAEGQAEYFSDLFEREEIVGPFLARDILTRVGQASSEADAEGITQEVRKYLSDIRQGRILQPFEYARVARVLEDAPSKAHLSDLLSRSADKFWLDSPQQAYDFSWALFQFLVVQPEGGKTAEAIADLVDHLKIGQNTVQLAALERQMFANVRRISGATSKKEVVDKLLPGAIQQCDESGLNGQHWKCYLGIAHLLATVPEEPVLWGYLGDVFLGAGQRDMFFIYYDRAMDQRNQGSQMSGNVRIINRYVSALWDIGQIQRALDVQRDYTITSLDLPAIMEMTLRREFAIRANQAAWKPETVSRLETEYELGLALINLSSLSNSSIVDEAISTQGEAARGLITLRANASRRIRTRANELIFQLGYPDGKIPNNA